MIQQVLGKYWVLVLIILFVLQNGETNAEERLFYILDFRQ